MNSTTTSTNTHVHAAPATARAADVQPAAVQPADVQPRPAAIQPRPAAIQSRPTAAPQSATAETPRTPMALSITGATKRYDSGFTLDDITFDLPAGYIMGLIGPNGAGKSTLIKLILNMIRRDAGEIAVLGMDNIAREEEVKEQLGVVFDTSYLYEQWRLGGIERIVAPLYPAWDHDAYIAYLDRFGLAGPANGRKRIKELSRGMQMKLMLAIALSHDAHLLILDEPTSGLDVLARDELMDMLHEYIEDGERSVLFSTHITADLERGADLITYINGGRLYFTGPKDEFEEAFRLVKGGPGELAQLPGATVLGAHEYATGFDALVRSELLPAALAAVPGLLVERASIDDVIRLTGRRGAGTGAPGADAAIAGALGVGADNGTPGSGADDGGVGADALGPDADGDALLRAGADVGEGR